MEGDKGRRWRDERRWWSDEAEEVEEEGSDEMRGHGEEVEA